MIYDPDIRAVDQFGERLEQAIRKPMRRSKARYLAAGAGLTVVVATPALALSGGFDFGGDVPRAGEPGGPPRVLTTADPSASVEVISILNRPGGIDALRKRLAPSGLKVKVEGRPVAAGAVGRIFGVQFPHDARFDANHRLVVEPDSKGTLIVTVGQAAQAGQQVGTSGLSLYEVLPQVRDAVRRDDPRGSLERLRAMGFDVALKLVIDNPDAGVGGERAATGAKTIQDPPPDTVVLSVLNANGSNTATRQTRALTMELAPADSNVARSEP